MPATDYLMPDGLEWDELAALMGPLGAAPGLVGLSLGCVNPDKDPGGRYAERTCELLAGALGGSCYLTASGPVLALTRTFLPATRLPSSKRPDFERASVSVACAEASANSPSAFVLRL